MRRAAAVTAAPHLVVRREAVVGGHHGDAGDRAPVGAPHGGGHAPHPRLELALRGDRRIRVRGGARVVGAVRGLGGGHAVWPLGGRPAGADVAVVEQRPPAGGDAERVAGAGPVVDLDDARRRRPPGRRPRPRRRRGRSARPSRRTGRPGLPARRGPAPAAGARCRRPAPAGRGPGPSRRSVRRTRPWASSVAEQAGDRRAGQAQRPRQRGGAGRAVVLGHEREQRQCAVDGLGLFGHRRLRTRGRACRARRQPAADICASWVTSQRLHGVTDGRTLTSAPRRCNGCLLPSVRS